MSTQQEQKEVKEVPYTEDEKAYRSTLIRKLMLAQEERDKAWDEFDGMTYLQHYEANEKADQSYIPPKKNKEDTRIVTGYTHEKDNTLLSTLLNYNLEPDIKAFDENDLEINELGEIEEDLVRKSRLMEKYNEKRPLIYREFLAQGTCFVEEVWIEHFIPEKDLNPNWQQDRIMFKDLVWKTRLKKVYEGAEVNLMQGKKVYLGNMRQYFMSLQPYIFTQEIMSYAEAKAVYGQWERFEHVSKKPSKFVELPDTQTFNGDTLSQVEKDQVEVIKFQDKWANDFMILLNGVMMLPCEFPLTAISKSGEYTLSKGDLEPRPNFAISKSIPAKTKVDQAVLDELLKLMILKTKASFKPPMANNTKRVLSQNIFIPGTITTDIPKDSLYPLVESDGVTPGEFSFYQLVKEQLDAKSVNPQFAGEQEQGNQTATEILELKKQQMLKLGLSIDGIVNLEVQMSWLRLHTINCHWTLPIDQRIDQTRENLEAVYRTVTVDSEFDGLKGQRIIDFTTDTNRQSEDIHSDEEKSPKPVRKVYLHPELLRNLKAKWFIQIVPTEKNNDTLARILFIQNLREAMELFGPESVNLDHAKTRFATIIGEDYSKFFNDQGAIKEMLRQMEAQGQTGQPGQAGKPAARPGNASGSLTPREPRLAAAMEY